MCNPERRDLRGLLVIHVLLLGCVYGCSYVEIPYGRTANRGGAAPGSKVIGRTMELGESLNFTGWEVTMYPRNHTSKNMAIGYGFISIDLVVTAGSKLQPYFPRIPAEGLNE